MQAKFNSVFNKTLLVILLFSCGLLNAQKIQSRVLSQKIKVDALLYRSDGTIFASGGWNGANIYKIDPDGKVSVHASGFVGIVDMVWGANDTIIGSSYQTGELLKIAPDGTKKTYIRTSYGVASLYKDFNGDILCTINPGLAQQSPGSVIKVKSDGSYSTFAYGGTISKPSGITQDNEGNYYISNLGDGRITKVKQDGTKELFATIPATGTWKIGYIKFWKGSLYTSAISQNKIYKTSLNGDVVLYAGNGSTANSDGSLLEASIREPNGMAEAGDTLYIISGINPTNSIRYITDNTTDIENDFGNLPSTHKLELNYPNPFNPTTNINYKLGESTFVNLKIYNSLGELVNTIVHGNQHAGNYTVQWNGNDYNGNQLTSGLYIYELTADNYRESKKMLLLK